MSSVSATCDRPTSAGDVIHSCLATANGRDAAAAQFLPLASLSRLGRGHSASMLRIIALLVEAGRGGSHNLYSRYRLRCT
jgi:hypothetical protein